MITGAPPGLELSFRSLHNPPYKAADAPRGLSLLTLFQAVLDAERIGQHLALAYSKQAQAAAAAVYLPECQGRYLIPGRDLQPARLPALTC